MENHIIFLAIRTVVHQQLDVDIADDLSKIPTHKLRQKVARSFCNKYVFILPVNDHDIVVYKIIIRNRIKNDNSLSEKYELDSN